MYESYLEHVAQFGEKIHKLTEEIMMARIPKENCRWVTRKEQGRIKKITGFFAIKINVKQS